jgi:hypothetical protein
MGILYASLMMLFIFIFFSLKEYYNDKAMEKWMKEHPHVILPDDF